MRPSLFLFIRPILKFPSPCTKHAHLSTCCRRSATGYRGRCDRVTKLIVFSTFDSFITFVFRLFNGPSSLLLVTPQTSWLRFTTSACTTYVPILLKIRYLLILVLQQISVLHRIWSVGYLLEFLISYLFPVVLWFIMHEESVFFDPFPAYSHIWLLCQDLTDQIPSDDIYPLFV